MATFDRALLTFLLNALWQVPLMAAAGWAASAAMRNNPARHRHAVWMMAMAASLLLPLTSIESGGMRSPTAQLTPSVPRLESGGLGVTTAGAVRRSANVSPAPARSIELKRATAAVLTLAWVVFFCVRMARLAVRAVRTARLRRESEAFDASPALRAVWQRAEAAFGLRGVELRVSAAIGGPVMTGVLRKTIILPAELVEDGSEAMLTTAIGHEMAHVARHDFPQSLLVELLWLPLAFQPAAWLIYRAIGRTRELATDELVTERLIDADSYAQSIVAIAGQMAGVARAGLTLGVFDGDILEERISRLTERPTERPRAGLKRARLLLASGISALAVCVAAGAGLAISARAQSAAMPEIRLGVDAYNAGQIAAAQDHFQKAVAADPDSIKARLFLATATLDAVRSMLKGPIDMGKSNVYDPVVEQFDQVLARDSMNQPAIFGLATLGGPRRSQQAHDLLVKLIVADPKNKEAYYTVGVLDWQRVFGPVMAALKQEGLTMATQQIPDAGVRAELRTQYQPAIEEGYRVLQLALNLDPQYANAMAYMNLLYRMSAEIAETKAEADAFTAKGDHMVKMALETQKASGPWTAPPATLNADVTPNAVTMRGAILEAPKPPPPPPPPPASAK